MSKLKVEFVDNSSSQYDENATLINFSGDSEKLKGKLFLGDQYSMSYVQLKFRNIKAVVCCSRELFGYCKESNVEYFKFDPDDKKIDAFSACNEFIESVLTNKGSVVVCCENGNNKSAAVLISYLINRNKWTLSDIVNKVQRVGGLIKMKPSLSKVMLLMEKKLIGTSSMVLDGNNLVSLKPFSNTNHSSSNKSKAVPKTNSQSGWVMLGIGVGVISLIYGVLYAVTGKL